MPNLRCFHAVNCSFFLHFARFCSLVGQFSQFFIHFFVLPLVFFASFYHLAHRIRLFFVSFKNISATAFQNVPKPLYPLLSPFYPMQRLHLTIYTYREQQPFGRIQQRVYSFSGYHFVVHSESIADTLFLHLKKSAKLKFEGLTF